jgi:ankyrin repeat protein
MLDEFIHHGAEIALLRDLWRWQHPIAVDSATERVMRGDTAVLDELSGEAPAADLVETAAAYGRWNLALGLIERGAPVATTGSTPLHRAAGAGELEVVQALLERGGDLSARDPEFHATPQQWAEFLHQARVVSYLRGLG